MTFTVERRLPPRTSSPQLCNGPGTAVHYGGMGTLSRRHFLSLAAAAGAATAVPPASLLAQRSSQDFTFLHITDTHLQPELHGVEGCAMAFKKARTLHADFAIQGGDHIFDALAVPASRSTELYRLYAETEQQLSLKTYHAIGNHDVVGLNPKSGMSPKDAGYGKGYFQDHIGPLYQSFDHKGVHILVLDSIGITPDRNYYGFIDDAQMAWLKADLAKQSASTPIIITTHMPLVTSFVQYLEMSSPLAPRNSLQVSNAHQIFPLLEGRNVIGVLQGHTHVNERVEWKGVQYLTSGAVCGNWWEGQRLGIPEGFTVCTVRNGKLTTRYETYGFHAEHQGAEHGTKPSA
ncbi:metallophosphoesterase family protein [Terriglobus roseus]|uniref:Tat (Twin-arginine translocation) pathway signal sequence n=1 Tax=Terriglobus roseus TaxID=392734 RepID=A0A1H4Q7W5_9BACT|nr:metallophosphoesterase [Terriglobus roseus]SEC15735.1 Tat (twin-arginine translocation) pathway signal sequence [Terriglobus roseus]